MKKALGFIAAFFLINSLIGQVIVLKQKKSDTDIKVVSGSYDLYLKKADVLDAINYIDKTLSINNSTIAADVKSNKIKIVDLKSTENKDFVELLKKNLGLYLLIKGKASVYNGQKQILELTRDDAPDEIDLDGTVTKTIFFSEKNSDKELFLGSINAKLL